MKIIFSKEHRIGTIGLFLLIDLFLFSILDYSAIFLWLFWGGLGFVLMNLLPSTIKTISNHKQKYIFVFLIVSFLGLILHLDNFNNINLYFGFAGDDLRYYKMFEKFYSDGFQSLPEFSEVLAFLYYPYTSLIGIPSLMGILPFNWMLTTLSIFLCHILFSEILNTKEISFNITLLFLIGNYVFIDAMIRFYREPLIVFLSLISFYYIITNKRLKAAIPLPFLAVLRGANFLLVGVFYLLNKIKKKKHIFFAIITGVLLLVVVSKYFGTIMMYSTALGRAENMSFYQEYSTAKILDSRGDLINVEEGNENSLTGNLYQSGGILYYISKPLIFLFFPLRFENVFSLQTFSLNTYEVTAKGVYLFSIYMWGVILLWIYAFPRLIFGMVRSMKEIQYLKILIFFIFVLMVASFISFQQRHFLIGAIFIPFFVHLSILYPPKKNKLLMGNLFVLLGILFYNLFL